MSGARLPLATVLALAGLELSGERSRHSCRYTNVFLHTTDDAFDFLKGSFARAHALEGNAEQWAHAVCNRGPE